jgi:hypothetical protein
MKAKVRITGRHPGIWWSLGALFVYTLTTCVMMYPVSLHPASMVVGEERGDVYEYIYQLWWAKQGVLEPDTSLINLTLMNHPVGIEHPFLLTMIGVQLLALPFSLFLSPAATYNSQILLSFVLSGMTMYWFSTELTGSRRAGLVGGFIFAFFLNKTGHVMAGHLPQATAYLFPLYALFLWRVIQKPSWRTVLVTAPILTLACLIHVMHIPYIVLPVTVAVLLVAIVETGRAFFTWRRLGSLGLVFSLAAVMIVPFLLPTVMHATQESGYLSKTGIVNSSTDLLAFFTPSPYHPILSGLGLLPSFAEQVFPSQESLREGLAYPGVLAVGLALWGLIRKRQGAWIWGVLALAAAVLSLGPLLKVGGELALYRVDMEQSYIVLPYALLKQMPLLHVGRTPGRLNQTTMFALAMLASFGVAELSSLLARRPHLLTSLLALMLVGIGLEYVAIWPFPASTAGIPPTIQSIAGESSDGALLYPGMPRNEVNHQALYFQTVARRPVVGGRLHRILPEVYPWWETLSGLAHPDREGGDAIPRPDIATKTAWLCHFDVDYVVLHGITEEWRDPSYRDFVENLLGPPRYEDPLLVAYAVPSEAPPLKSAQLYTLNQEDWYPPEQDGEMWRRWMGDDGELYLYSTRDELGSLRFTVDSHLDTPVLEIHLGGQLLDSFVVGERATHTTRPFTLRQGMNVFRFNAPGGCQQVVDDPRCWSEALLVPPEAPPLIPCDPETMHTTCRTFVLDHISFAPQEELRPGEARDINFGDRMRLRGWGLDKTGVHPGTALTVTLAWEATIELSDQYVVFLHLLSPDGTLVAQHDAAPVGWVLPHSAWPAGTTLSYPVTIEIPEELPADEYRLLVGVYLWPSVERLPVLADVPGAEMRVVDLGGVQIVP